MNSATPERAIKAALFDLGGVLIDWDPRHLYRKLFADETAMEHFLATVCTAAWNQEQDAGRACAEGTRLLIERHPAAAAEITAFYGRWAEMLRGEIGDSVALLAALHEQGVPLFALTNWSAETFPIARQRFGFLDLFNGIIVSGEERLRKPDRRIFQLAIERFALVPETTLFIDDSIANIAAAADLAFRTHHFSGAAGLREALATLGMLAA